MGAGALWLGNGRYLSEAIRRKPGPLFLSLLAFPVSLEATATMRLKLAATRGSVASSL
jgi:hypothetical protein